MNDAPVGLLYDVHGNLVALRAVLGDAERSGVSSCVLGGDYATFGPWPRETVELLETLPAVARIRGNVDRWLREEPEVPASAMPRRRAPWHLLSAVQPRRPLTFGAQPPRTGEAYVVISGSGHVRLDDEIRELRCWDVVRVNPATVRAFEAGDDGLELIAIGSDRPDGGDGVFVDPAWID